MSASSRSLDSVIVDPHKVFPKMFENKTIFDAAKATESLVKKIIDLEVEQHNERYPDYVFTGVRVVNKDNGCVTYQLEYTHKKLIPR